MADWLSILSACAVIALIGVGFALITLLVYERVKKNLALLILFVAVSLGLISIEYDKLLLLPSLSLPPAILRAISGVVLLAAWWLTVRWYAIRVLGGTGSIRKAWRDDFARYMKRSKAARRK